MNKILISNGKAVSSVLSESDAIKRLAEEVEDVGCAGGACTL